VERLYNALWRSDINTTAVWCKMEKGHKQYGCSRVYKGEGTLTKRVYGAQWRMDINTTAVGCKMQKRH